MMKDKAWIAILYFTGIARLITCDKLFDLQEKLFVKYDPGIRPHCGPNKTTVVKIDVALRQLLSLNEPTQEIKIKIWLRLFWEDCRLTWNETEFGTETLHLPRDRVWIPDLSLFDCTDEEALRGIKDYRAKIFSDGGIQYQWPTVITSFCSLNVRNFPLDSQTCEFVFSSWIYTGKEIDWVPYEKEGNADLENFQENATWIVMSFRSKRHSQLYRCCKDPFTDMRYYLKIKRRYINHIVTLVFPCLLISFLPLLGFLIPVSYGEKVSLQVTMMLSLAVFLMVITDSLPPSSDSMPLLGIYFVSSLSLVGMSCVMTVVVINVHYKSKRAVDPWMKKYIIGKLGKILLVETEQPNEMEATQRPLALDETTLGLQKALLKNTKFDKGDDEKLSGITSNIRTAAKQLHTIEQRFHEKEMENERAKQWHLLAIVVDRVFFVFSFIILFVVLMAFFPHSE